MGRSGTHSFVQTIACCQPSKVLRSYSVSDSECVVTDASQIYVVGFCRQILEGFMMVYLVSLKLANPRAE